MIAFGTDGIRGRAGQAPITPEVGVAVGRAAARLAREAGGEAVVVGRDSRPSGAALEAAVAEGVAAEGLVARVAGLVPTSAVSTALAEGLGAAGVVITASHNPAPDNGFKVLGAGGRKLEADQTARVEAWIAQDPAEGSRGRVEDVHARAWSLYTRALADRLPERRALAGARVAVDLANGACAPIVPWLQREVGARLVVVGSGDGLVNDGVGAVHPERLAKAVVDKGCIGGFAVDGDGDRCVLVDERGHVVPGDGLAWLLATGLGLPSLAVTVMSNAGLEASLPGVRVVRTEVGDKHLQEAMKGGIALGCEESGHVLFGDGLPTGDGILTGLRALGLALARGSVSGAVAGFRPFPRLLAKVPVSDRPPLSGVLPLREAALEGERELGDGGRVFLRYSGTEPLLRVLVEGADAATVERVTARVTRAAREALK